MASDYRKRFYERYVTDQWQYVEKISPQSFDLTAKIYQKYLASYLPADKSAPILDVACGAGHFLHYLQKKGFENAKGIDLGREQLDIARKMGVVNVENEDLFDHLRTHVTTYDLIVASQIIEHFNKAEAMDFLDSIYRSLKNGGKVIVFTPNISSFSGSISAFGDFTHELQFSSRSLAQLLRACRFSNVETFGIGTVAYDFRSSIRTFLCRLIMIGTRIRLLIERGTGRSIWKDDVILEPFLCAVGQK